MFDFQRKLLSGSRRLPGGVTDPQDPRFGNVNNTSRPAGPGAPPMGVGMGGGATQARGPTPGPGRGMPPQHQHAQDKAQGPPPLPLIFEITEENFNDAFFSKIPVVLDCYATWCAPCKQLTPLLEAIVSKAKGRLLLAKMDVDKFPEMAQRLEIRQLPTVFALKGGKLLNKFTGLLPPAKLAAFLSGLCPELQDDDSVAAEMALSEANGLLAKAIDDKPFWPRWPPICDGAKLNIANRAFQQILEKKQWKQTHELHANVGLVRVLLLEGRLEEAKALTDDLTTRSKKDKALAAAMKEDKHLVWSRIQAQVDLALQMKLNKYGVLEAEAAVKADPKDHAARLGLALSVYSEGQFEAAILHICNLCQVARGWDGGRETGSPKATALRMIQALPHEEGDSKHAWARTKLANALF